MTAVTPGRETLSDDLLMDAIRVCGLNGPMRITTIKSRWKDGIDIDEPSYDVRRLATEIALRLAAKPDDEGVLTALVDARPYIASAFNRSQHAYDKAALEQVDDAIRSLSTTGEPKR